MWDLSDLPELRLDVNLVPGEELEVPVTCLSLYNRAGADLQIQIVRGGAQK
jgi:hypothetical protein